MPCRLRVKSFPMDNEIMTDALTNVTNFSFFCFPEIHAGHKIARGSFVNKTAVNERDIV